jgi:hypothetical protein
MAVVKGQCRTRQAGMHGGCGGGGGSNAASPSVLARLHSGKRLAWVAGSQWRPRFSNSSSSTSSPPCPPPTPAVAARTYLQASERASGQERQRGRGELVAENWCALPLLDV